MDTYLVYAEIWIKFLNYFFFIKIYIFLIVFKIFMGYFIGVGVDE
jgi:hypothetical protein